MAKPPFLSIVIPTHKRSEILSECLHRLERQTMRDRLEVIVVSDGEDAKTTELLAKNSFQVPITFFSIPKSQQGVARNRGAEKARGELCLFIGDDIFLVEDACARHCAIHEKETSPIAVLGHVTWDPSLPVTPVMRWLEKTGWQFGFPFLKPYEHAFVPSEMQHRFSYASFISLPTPIARKIFFREDTRIYGWEDIEWGMRLKEEGLRLFYEPDAHALHHHSLTLEDSLKRMKTLGESAAYFQSINPSLAIVPQSWKYFAYLMLSLLPTLRGRHASAFLNGLNLARGKQAK